MTTHQFRFDDGAAYERYMGKWSQLAGEAFPDDTFDVAVMPLVIFFVPDPAQGVSEMARVVCPGGTVAAYAWDMTGGGFPYESLKVEMRGLGVVVPVPPSRGASRI